MKEQRMVDRAYTTLLAWPYPGREHLSEALLEALGRHNALGDCDTPDGREDHYGDGSYVRPGDVDSGSILKIVDAEADEGTTAFDGLITLLCAAGLSVLGWNQAGAGYGASWEYHPAGQDTVGAGGRVDCGELIVAAGDLLQAGEQSLDDVDDNDLAVRVRERLSTHRRSRLL
jgi:hypothetical protein